MSAIFSMPVAGALTEAVPSLPSVADGTGLLAGGTLFTGMLAGALAIPAIDPMAGSPAPAACLAEDDCTSEDSAALSLADAPLLAQILQAMGIQATPERLASLTPLEMQQVASALDFVATQLGTGRYAAEDVMEEAEVLLPQGLEFTGLPVPPPDVMAHKASAPDAAQAPAPAGIPAHAQDAEKAVVATAQGGLEVGGSIGAASKLQSAAAPALEDPAADAPSSEPAALSPEGMLALVESARRLLGQGSSTVPNAGQPPAAPVAAAVPAAPAGRSADSALEPDAVDCEVGTAPSAVAVERPGAPARRARGRAEAAPASPPADASIPVTSRSADASAAALAAPAAPANSEPPKGVRLLRQAFEESMQGGFDAGIRAGRTSGNAVDRAGESAQPAFRPGSPASEMVARQVFDGMHVLLTEGRDEMRMSLWPENLGRVSVRLKIEDGERVDVRVLVQSDSVKQALDAAIPTLRETLSRQGLELGSLSVSVGGKERGGDPGDQGDARRNPSRRGAELEDAVASRAPLLRGIDTGWRNGRNSIDVLL